MPGIASQYIAWRYNASQVARLLSIISLFLATSANYSGPQLVCCMYVGFKIVTPEHDIGFDLSKEYEAAKAMAE